MKARLSYPIHSLMALAALLGAFATAPAPRAFQMEGGLPLYIYPRAGQVDWERAFTAGGGKVGFIIANVYNGPGTAVSGTWTTAIDSAVASGISIYGYVYSNYGLRDPAEIDADIRRWFQLYPQVTGIFIDETASSAAALPYYTARFQTVKSINPAHTVVINPGTVTDEGYMNACDINTIFESSYASWLTKTLPSWVSNYSEDRFYAIVYGVPSQIEMEQVIATARDRNFGNVFVTSATGPSSPLPVYFESELDAVLSMRTVEETIPVEAPELQLTSCWSSNITGDNATITWTASVPAEGILTYWREGDPVAWMLHSPAFTDSHSVTLNGLSSRTFYQYQVSLRSLDGQVLESGIQRFRTKNR